MSDTRTVLMIGDTVDLVIGPEFQPMGRGEPILLPKRHTGQIIAWNEFGTDDVKWPNGETFAYEPALLRRRCPL